jgi:uncharacterized protein (DUF2147 family)
MQIFRQVFLFILISLFSIIANAAVNQSGINGTWETIDDRTGLKKALVVLKEKQGILEGRIKKVYWRGQKQQRCVHCQGDLKNQPIEGMRILWGLQKASANHWTGGYILDPHNGRVYRVNIKKQGEKLFVRAYFGVSLIGRTQEWHSYSKGVK